MQRRAPELPVYESYNHEKDVPLPVRSRSREFVRKAAIVGASAASVVGTFVVQNFELIQATEAYLTYEKPEKGDIIPERTGCAPYVPSGNTVELDGVTDKNDVGFLDDALKKVLDIKKYVPENDQALQEVKDASSLSRSFTNTSADQFSESERVIWPFNNYFDTSVGSYTTNFGLHMKFFMHEGDLPYLIDTAALEQMVQDIFYRTDLYANPEVRHIMECKRVQVFEQRELLGHTADVNISVEGDKGLEGNNIVTFNDDTKDSHSAGLGISDTRIRLLYKDVTPDHIMIVTGGNVLLQPNKSAVNRRFLHELLHVLLFQDLSDTISEVDEQERFVKYIAMILRDYYSSDGSLPVVVQIPPRDETLDYCPV